LPPSVDEIWTLLFCVPGTMPVRSMEIVQPVVPPTRLNPDKLIVFGVTVLSKVIVPATDTSGD